MLKGIVNRDEDLKNEACADVKSIEQEALKRFLKASERKVKTHPTDEKLFARRRVIDTRDPIAMERVLGENDLMPIAYLQRGLNVGNSVCRVMIRDKMGNIAGSGTGFLVAPGILMTNNHVLPDADTALYSIAEFNYQNDADFMPCPVSYFRLEPKRYFITDAYLDFTLVAVEEMSKEKAITDFGFIKLIADEGKILEGEYVSIIQHPKGGPKSVTLRENKVSYIYEDFIHYMTDTEPGSSGSPVFNDQWVAVGLHHSGVPDPDNKGGWIANEGIRISSIAEFMRKEYVNMNEDMKKLTREIFPEICDSSSDDKSKTPKSKGYDPAFLGEEYEVKLPKLSEKMEDDVSKMEDGSYVLDYVHFSIVMCKSRGLAYFTGVNIDGNQRVKIKRGADNWKFDLRINEKDQYGNEVYAKNDLDRGHLVKREDPNWGEDAYLANEDTFHFTNSAPQHKDLNQKIWLGLEDYILKNAHNLKLKVSVFTGPVFRESDMVYRKKYRIPADFWKVAVMVKDDGELSATAYIQTQEDMISNLEFVYGEYKTYQVPISKIEELTGLDFGELNKFDPLANVEFSGLLISDENNIRL